MTLAPPDPFADHTPGRGGDGCICGGAGMVYVDDDYVNRHAARASNGTHMTPGLLDALRESVFPCYDCRPDQYEAWSKGRFGPGAASSTRRRRHRKERDRGR